MLQLIHILFYVVISVSSKDCKRGYGLRQSPININMKNVRYDWAPPLKWSYGYSLTPNAMFVNNTGNALRLTVNHKVPLQISSGILDVPYNFQELHFHWGLHDGIGGEHQINGNTYPLEMHVVHSQNITKNSDEFVVVAYLFKVTPWPNVALQNLIDVAIEAGYNKNKTIRAKPFPLSQLLSAESSYFTYQGSLTTPPYTESAIWIISTLELPISESQLDVLREVAKWEKGLQNNYRCIQDINHRYIWFIKSE